MKRRLIFAVALLGAISMILAPFAFAADTADTLKQADRAFNQATREKGLEGWLTWFADDASLPQQSPPVVGKDALREFYQDFFSNPNLDFRWTPDHAQLFPNGKLGYTSGRYTMNFTAKNGNKVHNTGNYLTVWKKQADGSWKVLSDFGAPDPKPESKVEKK